MVSAVETGGGVVELVVAPPRAGKTEYALGQVTAALQADRDAVMTVSDRQLADTLSARVIDSLGASQRVRPVTTLAAVAFSVIADARAKENKSKPRLLNGGEQDVLLKSVLAVHLDHARSGDSCDTCALLRDYFMYDDWSHMVSDNVSRNAGSTSEEAFERGVSDAFVAQLRDMLARLDELGVVEADEDALLAKASADSRLVIQWRLAFALRREYIAAQQKYYQDEYRLDASFVMVAAAHAVTENLQLPELLVVDDFQDVTLAGLRFIEALHAAGTQVVLVGNPDESVQSFRGSYPEYLFREACQGALQAQLHALNEATQRTDYLRAVCSRVSMSIAAEGDDLPSPSARPGKLIIEGSSKLVQDESFGAVLYRSASEEFDDVAWSIKRRHLDRHVQWNDMAIIAHDNAVVRAFGERLRRDGVPVRYSSVTRSLREEPFVQGLFAIVELAHLRNTGLANWNGSAVQAAAYVRSRVTMAMNSTLISGADLYEASSAGQIEQIQAAMSALESLAALAQEEGADSAVSQLAHSWEKLSERIGTSEQSVDTRIEINNSLYSPEETDDLAFGSDAMYLMLALDDSCAPAADVLDSIGAVLGKGAQGRVFARLWDIVENTAAATSKLGDTSTAEQELFAAWKATGVDIAWQRRALTNSAEGRAANDRLDAAMRLFQAAHDASDSSTEEFIRQVRGMEVQADSLAKLGPIEQAVTLTTPAGASGRSWPYVWMPSIQQDSWPNLTERNGMFGAEKLVQLVLEDQIDERNQDGHDVQFIRVLNAEKKSFLVALSRADAAIHVSAVHSSELTPSEFLYAYAPEVFARGQERDLEHTASGTSSTDMLNADARDIVTAARVALVQCEADSDKARDAAAALAVLAQHGILEASPEQWAFTTAATERKESQDKNTVTLYPSAVDGLWACPVCWKMDNSFSGPRASSVATSFGTIIHAVAEEGGRLGLGSAQGDKDAIAASLQEIYERLRTDPHAIADPSGRFKALQKDASSAETLSNIAYYFATSVSSEKYFKNRCDHEIGELSDVECEKEFKSRFSIDDILPMYNGLSGISSPVNRAQLAALMGYLVGGWPEGMRDDIVVALSGRIDRLEHRTHKDGSVSVRLVDYKTGRKHTASQMLNDLQLVCYQLGLMFNANESNSPAQHPRISGGVLFDVEHVSVPGLDREQPEKSFQPPLFVHGTLNDEPFQQRTKTGKNPGSDYDIPVVSQSMPEDLQGVVSDDVWQQFASFNGTQTLWALTMIARVFYAAAAVCSDHIEAHPTRVHLGSCYTKELCPACKQAIETVMETREA